VPIVLHAIYAYTLKPGSINRVVQSRGSGRLMWSVQRFALVFLLFAACVGPFQVGLSKQAQNIHDTPQSSVKKDAENPEDGIRLKFQVSRDAPRWTLQLIRSNDGNTLEQAQLLDSKGAILQKMPVDLRYNEQADSDPASVFQDANFDGYLDIVLISAAGAGPNTSASVWIFDPVTQKFQFNAELSDLTSLEINPKSRTISSSSYCCAGLSITNETYSWRGQHLELIERVEQSPLDPQPKLPVPKGCHDPVWVNQTAEKLVGGHLQKIKSKRVPLCE
jgi:hypothetical protein